MNKIILSITILSTILLSSCWSGETQVSQDIKAFKSWATKVVEQERQDALNQNAYQNISITEDNKTNDTEVMFVDPKTVNVK